MTTAETTPDLTEAAAPSGCSGCGAAMERHQDWCLECGLAAPGRLGGLRPGWRAAGTTLALTLALVGGAGAASYAALSTDATREALAAAPMDGAPVAQAPPAVPAPAAPTLPAPSAPAVDPPATKLPEAPKATPVAPPSSPPLVAQVPSTPAPTAPTTKAPSSAKDEPEPDATVAGSRGAGTSAAGGRPKPGTPLTPITLGAGSVSVYDPYGRATATGAPAAAHDGDRTTRFGLAAPDDDRDLQVGVVVDLGAVKQVRGVELVTPSSGGQLELYATDGSRLPPDILDTRWDHPASRADVDGRTRGDDEAGDGVERVVFPKGGDGYRYVTFWFTAPAEGTRRVQIGELRILG